MRLNSTTLLPSVLILALFTFSPLFAGWVDQQCADGEYSFMPFSPATGIGQTFVPSESMHVGFDWWLKTEWETPHPPVTMVLRENDFSGPIVPGSTVTAVIPPGHWSGYLPFTFDQPIYLTPGNTYIIEVVEASEHISARADDWHCYNPGQAFLWGDPRPDEDFFFRTWVTCDNTVQADFFCIPNAGTLPMVVQMVVSLKNTFGGTRRRCAAHIDILLASGATFTNWRSGFTNLQAGWEFTENWSQVFPMLGTLQGDNVFTLIAEDVTPAPYNQPPYCPAGVTATASFTVTGVAP